MAIYTDLHHNGSARRLIFTLSMVSSAFGALNLIGNQRQMIGRPPPAPTSLALSPNNLRRISIHPLPSVQTRPIKCLHILSVYRPRSCMGRLRRAPWYESACSRERNNVSASLLLYFCFDEKIICILANERITSFNIHCRLANRHGLASFELCAASVG